MDKKLVDTWELLHMVDDKGQEKRPLDNTRTLIEFTEKGSMIVNRVDGDKPENGKAAEGGAPGVLKSSTGKYLVEKDEISITDDRGHSVRWPYKITGDTLVLSMPDKQWKLFLRRLR